MKTQKTIGLAGSLILVLASLTILVAVVWIHLSKLYTHIVTYHAGGRRGYHSLFWTPRRIDRGRVD